MAVTQAQSTGKSSKSSGSGDQPGPQGTNGTVTTDAVDVPSEVQAGDAPFDTTDPTERVSSIDHPDKGAAAKAGFGTVNAVVLLAEPETPETPARKDRTEKYQVTGPDGKLVTVEHNIDTGETRRV